jgi:hypothetical protein
MQEQDDVVKQAVLDTIDLFLDTSEAADLDGFNDDVLMSDKPNGVEFETVHDGKTGYFVVAGRRYKVTVMAEV